jgi:hypothetical protein
MLPTSKKVVLLCILYISVPKILNNNNFCNQHFNLLPKYQHSSPLHDALQQTASHISRWQKLSYKVEQDMMSQRGSTGVTLLLF